jgi:hypothetical protein
MNDIEELMRQQFERMLVEGLKGVPLMIEGVPAKREDGSVITVPPGAQFLAVVRAYLKDQFDQGKKKSKEAPRPAAPSGVLAEWLKSQPAGVPAIGPAVGLPFAAGKQ